MSQKVMPLMSEDEYSQRKDSLAGSISENKALTIDEEQRLKAKHLKMGALLTLAGGALWGLSGTCAQFLFEHKALLPEWLVSVRLFIAGLLLVIVALYKDREQLLSLIKNKKDLLDTGIYGLFGVGLCQLSYFVTISYSNAGTACVLQYFSPVLIIAWMALAHRKKPSKQELIAVVFALVGVFFVATGGHLSSLSLDLKTLIWGFIAAATVAVYTIQPVRILERYPAYLLLGIGMIIGGALLSPFTLWWQKTPSFDLSLLLGSAFIIFIGTICSFTLFMEGIKLVGPSKAGLYACIEPVSATLCSALFLHTSFSHAELFGFTLVLLVPFILGLKLKRRS